MDKAELKVALKNLGVPTLAYTLNGDNCNERIYLIKNEDKWKVSFYQRGEEDVMGTFTTEDAACKFMLNQLKCEI
jgi:hypothetical protein